MGNGKSKDTFHTATTVHVLFVGDNDTGKMQLAMSYLFGSFDGESEGLFTTFDCSQIIYKREYKVFVSIAGVNMLAQLYTAFLPERDPTVCILVVRDGEEPDQSSGWEVYDSFEGVKTIVYTTDGGDAEDIRDDGLVCDLSLPPSDLRRWVVFMLAERILDQCGVKRKRGRKRGLAAGTGEYAALRQAYLSRKAEAGVAPAVLKRAERVLDQLEKLQPDMGLLSNDFLAASGLPIGIQNFVCQWCSDSAVGSRGPENEVAGSRGPGDKDKDKAEDELEGGVSIPTGSRILSKKELQEMLPRDKAGKFSQELAKLEALPKAKPKSNANVVHQAPQ